MRSKKDWPKSVRVRINREVWRATLSHGLPLDEMIVVLFEPEVVEAWVQNIVTTYSVDPAEVRETLVVEGWGVNVVTRAVFEQRSSAYGESTKRIEADFYAQNPDKMCLLFVISTHEGDVTAALEMDPPPWVKSPAATEVAVDLLAPQPEDAGRG